MKNSIKTLSLFFIVICFLSTAILFAQEEVEKIDNSSCIECHETDENDLFIKDTISGSIHEGHECLDCHIHKNTSPHSEVSPDNRKSEGCRSCHEDIAEQYKAHGRAGVGEVSEMPKCADCHGYHDIQSSSNKNARTNPANLPLTCGKCHEDLNITKKFEILIDHPVDIYNTSIHGEANKEGTTEAASCNDCHSKEGTAHSIYSAGDDDSAINHFNIHKTCGRCHEQEEKNFLEGIHGKLLLKKNYNTPTCTHCHGEHGILSPSDPRSPVSKVRVTQRTCEPCHESISLTEKYGFSSRRPNKFIDTYHGLKSQSGDIHVANCASCHGYHKILPSSDQASTIHTDNLQATCGECHSGISKEIAGISIHEVNGDAEKSKIAQIIKIIYILLIILVIGFMVLHWTIDFIKQVILITKKPQVRRMKRNEVWQHTLLMVSFIVLVVTGFALRFGDSFIMKFLFGWDQGSTARGIIHRGAAVIMIISTIWHIFYLFTKRGKTFLKDIFPNFSDLKHLFQRIFYNLGLRKEAPRFSRFSYVEKIEYWALIWGNAVMIITGIILWFDNLFIKMLPKTVFDIVLVIHFYEAILATLAILIWHLYSTVFNPHVYPMNPSWITGKMPEDMFKYEHPDAEIDE